MVCRQASLLELLMLTTWLVGTNGSSVQAVLVSTTDFHVQQTVTDAKTTEEQLRMNDCYYEKKDWRVCRKEVSVEPQDRYKFCVISGFVLGNRNWPTC
jgi:hypothetical protein